MIASLLCLNALIHFNYIMAKDKWENLEAARISDTDVAFSYHPNAAGTEEYYVDLDFTGTSETGHKYAGEYKVKLVES